MDLEGRDRREDGLGGLKGSQQKNALGKYFTIGLVRIMGIAIMAVGFAIILNGLGDWPEMVGYFFIFMGGFEFIVMPIILARAWKTPENRDDRNAGIEKE